MSSFTHLCCNINHLTTAHSWVFLCAFLSLLKQQTQAGFLSEQEPNRSQPLFKMRGKYYTKRRTDAETRSESSPSLGRDTTFLQVRMYCKITL